MRLSAREVGSGPPVVLLHGLFGMARNLGVLMRGLAGTHRVIALDLRNHGGSPHGLPMDYPTMADDVLETLTEMGALPCPVMGHSMGGKVAMMLALTHPEAVSRLAVSDIAPVRYPPRNGPVVAALRGLSLRPGLTRAEADAALKAAIPDDAQRGFLLLNLRIDGEPGWRVGLEEIGASLPAIESWEAPAGARYDGPTVFIGGEQSQFIRAEHRPVIKTLFPSARFVTVKRAGHWVHVDNPDGFLAVMKAFLGVA